MYVATIEQNMGKIMCTENKVKKYLFCIFIISRAEVGVLPLLCNFYF